jgi:hypothetical protein
MAEASTFRNDYVFTGSVTFVGQVSITGGYITNTAVAAAAGIAASKLQHQHQPVVSSADQNTTIASSRQVIHCCRGATATITSFNACLTVLANAGAATVTVDLLKNGTTILTAPISISSADAIRSLEAGTLSSSSLVAGDILEVDVVATAGGGTLGKGLLAVLNVREDAQ